MNRCPALAAVTLLVSSVSAFAQYKLEPAGAPPSELPSAIAAVLQKDGHKVAGSSGAFCEVWFRTSLPSGPKSTEDAVSFPAIPHGALIGVIRFPGPGADRRGQTIKPGVYTLRYSQYPINGDHQGIAPQRDFALLTPVAADPGVNETPAFDPLMNLSRKASGTPHPAVLSLESPPAGAGAPALVKEGENDWTLSVKIGDTAIALIVVGKTDA
ncbi:MAG: hypothetical protein IT159_01065 [Bryobacterales bacterium]|nr:hypothetical protein [Bryobacterales bacterium]